MIHTQPPEMHNPQIDPRIHNMSNAILQAKMTKNGEQGIS